MTLQDKIKAMDEVIPRAFEKIFDSRSFAKDEKTVAIELNLAWQQLKAELDHIGDGNEMVKPKFKRATDCIHYNECLSMVRKLGFGMPEGCPKCEKFEVEKHTYTNKELLEKFSRVFTVNEYKGGWDDPLDYYIFEADKRLECSICDKSKPYTLTVEIPETDNGACSLGCPLLLIGVHNQCILHKGVLTKVRDGECKPSKGCPRYKP